MREETPISEEKIKKENTKRLFLAGQYNMCLRERKSIITGLEKIPLKVHAMDLETMCRMKIPFLFYEEPEEYDERLEISYKEDELVKTKDIKTIGDAVECMEENVEENNYIGAQKWALYIMLSAHRDFEKRTSIVKYNSYLERYCFHQITLKRNCKILSTSTETYNSWDPKKTPLKSLSDCHIMDIMLWIKSILDLGKYRLKLKKEMEQYKSKIESAHITLL